MSRAAPIAVVAGVSLGSYRRSNWRPARTGWRIHVLPGQEHRHGNLKNIWKRLLDSSEAWADSTDAGVHFLLAHDREDERPSYRDEFRRRSLRAVWLDRTLSVQYGSPDFRQAIADSWPNTVDDTAARGDWGWQERIGLAELVANVLDTT